MTPGMPQLPEGDAGHALVAVLLLAGALTSALPVVRRRGIGFDLSRVFVIALFLLFPADLALEAAVVISLSAMLGREHLPLSARDATSGLLATGLIWGFLNYGSALHPVLTGTVAVVTALLASYLTDSLLETMIRPAGGSPFLRNLPLLPAYPALAVAVYAAVQAAGAPGALSTAVPLVVLSLLLRGVERDRMENLARMSRVSGLTDLASSLMKVSSSGGMVRELELFLDPAGESGARILSLDGEGEVWTAWNPAGENRISPKRVSGEVPSMGMVTADMKIDGTAGCALGLSESRELFLFARGRAAGALLDMSPELRSMFVLVTANSWEALGHSMRGEAAFLAAAVLLARFADSKDDYTHGHSVRVAELSCELAEEMGLPASLLRNLRVGAILHDLGKVAIPADILTKRGLLTRQEREVIRKHPAEGSRIVEDLAGYGYVIPIIRSHHERMDGGGYPDGLRGVDIPLLARIVAVADTFDAITNVRTYHTQSGRETALETIRAGRGTQYDARVVDALVRVVGEGA